jgi:hypothetical protein
VIACQQVHTYILDRELFDHDTTRWRPKGESESGSRRLISAARLLLTVALKVRSNRQTLPLDGFEMLTYNPQPRSLSLHLHPSQALADPDLFPQSLVLHLSHRSHSLLLAPARVPLQPILRCSLRQYRQRVHVASLELHIRDGRRARRRSRAANKRLQPKAEPRLRRAD